MAHAAKTCMVADSCGSSDKCLLRAQVCRTGPGRRGERRMGAGFRQDLLMLSATPSKLYNGIEKYHIYRIVITIISIKLSLFLERAVMACDCDRSFLFGSSPLEPVARNKRYGGGLRRRVLLLSLLLASLYGCGGIPGSDSQVPVSQEGNASRTHALYEQYRDWKGTQYRYGGMSRNGVDCSGFVYLTFRSKFGVELPRMTWSQSQTGTGISRQELKSGDLVFFRTGSSKRHVGIYLERRMFLHASSSKGVMLSSLDNDYWASRYWQARRVVD